MSKVEKCFDILLGLYDWNIRCTDNGTDDYQCGYVDGIGQVILDLGKVYGEEIGTPHKYEAFKRVAEFETVERYILKYPVPISKLQI